MKKLLSSYPHLVKEWHPTKNGDSRPEDKTFDGSSVLNVESPTKQTTV